MITRVVHVNVVCSDIERSLKFYQDVLGAKVVAKIAGEESSEVGEAMGFNEPAKARTYMLSFGQGSKASPATLIDLLQWVKPSGKGKPYRGLNHVGICRIALAVDNVDKAYADLKAKGVEFISSPQDVDLAPAMQYRVCCFLDPDGVILELAMPRM